MTATNASARRIGTRNSKTRARLVDAAEELLLEEGYAAVTSRRVSARAGLKPQLVHYYFRSMEELFIEVFRRRADEQLARAQRLLTASPTLRAIWELNADLRGAAFNVEFVALAKHHPGVRAELSRYAERFRAMQLDAATTALAADGIRQDQLPPVVAILLMTGLTQVVSLERTLEFTVGHEATFDFVDRLLDRVEPGGPRPEPEQRP